MVRYHRDRLVARTVECVISDCSTRIDTALSYCARHRPWAEPPPIYWWDGLACEVHVSYRAMHARLGKYRGAAAAHPCAAECGRQAEHWAYDHADQYEVTEVVIVVDEKRPVAYSLSPQHYRPLCRPCHAREDRGDDPVPPRVDSGIPTDAPAVVMDILGPRPESDVDLRKPPRLLGARKHCTNCRMVKDFGAFSPDKWRPTGRANRCRRCDAKQYRQKRAAAGHTVKPHVHPRLSRASAAYTPVLKRARDRVVAIYGGKCVWCGAADRLEFDHPNNDGRAHRAVEHYTNWLKRVSCSGRRDDQWEIQLLCKPCHRGPGWKQRRATATPARAVA